jgi:hypothetical protein
MSDEKTDYSHARLGVALLLTMSAAFLGVWPGAPEWWAPVPLVSSLPVVMLVFRFGAPVAISVAVILLLGPLLLLAWAPFLTHGTPHVPQRSIAGFFVLVVLDILWVAMSLGSGLHFRGRPYVFATLTLQLFVLSGCVFFLIRSRTHPTWSRNLVFHCSVVVWLCWCAFPYFGELP